MAVEASRIALKRASIEGKEIGAIYVGSESHPYAVKPSSSIVGEALSSTPEMTAVDLEFACKAGTAGIEISLGLVKAGYVKYSLAIGSDTAQGRPGDALEYSAASGAGAYIIGKDNVLAEIETFYSYTTDTPDFWRRPKADYPSHAARFTGEPAYFKHVINATKGLLEKTGYKISDFNHVIFHQPNGKFPMRAAKKLGVSKEQLKHGFLVNKIGNTYSANVLIALANVLDHSNENELILLTSFGSGAGSDSFAIRTTELLKEKREKGKKLEYFLNRKRYISYAEYIKKRGKLKM